MKQSMARAAKRKCLAFPRADELVASETSRPPTDRHRAGRGDDATMRRAEELIV